MQQYYTQANRHAMICYFGYSKDIELAPLHLLSAHGVSQGILWAASRQGWLECVLPESCSSKASVAARVGLWLRKCQRSLGVVRSCLLRLQAADGRYGEGHRNFGRMARKRRQAPRRLAVQCPWSHGVEQRYHGREVAATWDWHWPQRSRAAICSSLVGCHSDSLRSILPRCLPWSICGFERLAASPGTNWTHAANSCRCVDLYGDVRPWGAEKMRSCPSWWRWFLYISKNDIGSIISGSPDFYVYTHIYIYTQ